MAPKNKSNKTEWQMCNVCNLAIHTQDLDKHALTCNIGSSQWLEDSRNADLKKVLRVIDQKFIHSCIKPNQFMGKLLERPSKMSDEFKHIEKQTEENIATFHLSTMKLAGLSIGGLIALHTCETSAIMLRAWPSKNVKITSVGVHGSVVKALKTKPDAWVVTEVYNSSALPAAEIIFKPKKSSSFYSSPGFLNFLRNHEEGKLLSPTSIICLNYFGKPCELEVFKITGDDGSVFIGDNAGNKSTNVSMLDDTTSDLTPSMDRLSLYSKEDSLSFNDVTEEMCSTPLRRPPNDQFHTPDTSCLARGDEPTDCLFPFYVITEETKLFIENKGHSNNNLLQKEVGFDSIGGLELQINRLRDLIELPTKNADSFNKFGLKQSVGILLFGPPGTGKTLLARAVANELDHHFIVINGPEVFSRFYGESETRLRTIFSEAEERSPSIIFVDEFDALCSKREGFQSDQEKRVVSTLLTLMDGISASNKQITVLAATNKPDFLDPAVRRPGRLDQEIEIGVPTARQRLDILTKLLAKMRHDVPDEEIIRIADKSHGFVGADLAAICREAGICAMKRVLGMNVKPMDTKSNLDESLSKSVFVTVEDLKYAAALAKPSAMREVSIDVPKVNWSDIGGQDEVKRLLYEAVELPLKNPEVFERLGIRPPCGVLMYGPPGCSKTMVAKALATESGLNFLAIKGPELFNKWVGESERGVRELFRKARGAAPSIVFFDEIDALAVERGSSGGSGGGQVGDRVLAQLLTELDGIENLKGVLIVAATNRPDMIDKALLRPGRLDRIIYVPLPDAKTREDILKIQFETIPVSSNVNAKDIACKTERYSGAEIVAVCHEAAYNALRRNIDVAMIDHEDFLHSLTVVTPRTTDEMIKFYGDYSSKSIIQ